MLDLHRFDSRDFTPTQFLNERGPSADVLDEDNFGFVLGGEGYHGCPEFRVVDPLPPDVNQIPPPNAAGDDPRRAD